MAFAYYRAITIDHTKCGTADSANFPMLYTGFGSSAHIASASGYDVRFFSDSGLTSALSYELVPGTYNSGTGAGEWWVKIPTLAFAGDTVIYVAYGDSSITTDGSSTGAWNSDYKLLWHFGTAVSLNATDSTSNGNNGTITSATATAGKVGGGASFNGVSATIVRALTPTIPMTVVGWVSCSPGVVWSALATAGNWFGYYLAGGLTSVAFTTVIDNDFSASISATGLTSDAWYRVVAVMASATSRTLYINGASVGTNTANRSPGSVDKLALGASVRSSTDNYYLGLADEFAMIGAAWSPSWVTADFNNQNSPSTFYANGPEVGGASGFTPLLSDSWGSRVVQGGG